MEKRAALALERKRRYTDIVIGYWKDAQRERIARTFELAGCQAYRGDCHVHSTFSDGVGTVADIAEWMQRAGLDFLFVTDHSTVAQKRECRRHPNLWWGQEPGMDSYHLGILNLDRRLTLTGDLASDYSRAEKAGGLAYVPHPAGWFPTTRYSREQMDVLNTLGDSFAIEIINGANNLFDCFDVTDALSVRLWDKHLRRGKRVIGLGNTDAHLPQAIGDVWNGVLAQELSRESIVTALRQGRLFVSDGPVVELSIAGAGMGEVLQAPSRRLSVEIACADSEGLASVRVIKDARVWQLFCLSGRRTFRRTLRANFPGRASYYRLECLTVDRRRAYSNPVYVVG